MAQGAGRDGGRRGGSGGWVVLVSHGPPWLLLGEDIFTNGQIGKFEEKSF